MQTGLKARVFDIEKYAINDGPGIRTTVFFKGCPMRCAWCQNPESIEMEQGVIYEPVRCIGCGRCASCPAIRPDGKRYGADCVRCYKCAENCPTGAIRLIYTEYTVDELFGILLRDKVFFDISGGGVTCSGGESLIWADFILDLFSHCKAAGIGTAIETSGYVPFSAFEAVLPYTDLFFYDLKLYDDEMHKRYTGVGNALIKKNLGLIIKRGAAVVIRIPLVPGVTDTVENLTQTGGYLQKEYGRCNVELLQFNRLAGIKYKQNFFVDEERGEFGFYDAEAQSEQQMLKLQKIMQSYGHMVTLLYNKGGSKKNEL